MKNEVFKTDQTSEIGMSVKPSPTDSKSSVKGPMLSNSINDAFVSIPPEELSSYQNKFSVFERIPNIIKLSTDEIRINKEVKQRKPEVIRRNRKNYKEIKRNKKECEEIRRHKKE